MPLLVTPRAFAELMILLSIAEALLMIFIETGQKMPKVITKAAAQRKLGISATDVYAELLQLELQGKIAALSGGRYQRIT